MQTEVFIFNKGESLMYQAITCEAKDIIALNQSKEYTLTATPLLEKLMTEKRITSPASKLWQILFSKSKFSPELSFKISYSNLALTFGKSTRTIARWVKSLEKAGYLTIQHNFDDEGGQLKNTLLVRLPQDVLQQVRQAKDRKSSKNSESSKNSGYEVSSPVNDYPADSHAIEKTTDEPEMPAVSAEKSLEPLKIPDSSEKGLPKAIVEALVFEASESKAEKAEISAEIHALVLEPAVIEKLETNENLGCTPQIEEPADIDAKEDDKEIALSSPLESASESLPPGAPCDKNVMGGSDKSVLHIIPAKDILKNNNGLNEADVVVLDEEAEDKESTAMIHSVENEIETLKNQIIEESMVLKELNQLPNCANTRDQTLKIIENIGRMNSKIDFLKREKEKIKGEVEERKKNRKKEAFLRGNAENVHKAKGGRNISSFTFKRLVGALSGLGYKGNELNLLLNEILFAVRFGSLQKGMDGSALNIEKAINIGIKLVREKRWTTPSEIANFTLEE